MVITLHATIHDSGVALLSNALLGDIFVDPIRIAPHGGIDSTKFDGTTRICSYCFAECTVEFSVIKKDVWVVKPSIEVTLDRLHGLYDPVQLLISRQDDECGVGAWLIDLGLQTSIDKNLVILLAYFADGEVC